MDLKQLSYFVTVIQEGTISGAARKLHLTQPPLSAQMKLLEEEAGCLLFERGSRHIQPTAAGQMLYGRAIKMLELADITARELKDYREGTAGILRLGVVSSVGSTYLIHAVRNFQKQYPHIDFELTEGNTYQLLEQLSSGLIELALVRTPFSGQGLTSLPLIEEPLLAVGNKRYFPEGDTFTLSDLSGLPLILYRRWETILLDSFREAGLVPHIFCKNDDARTSAIWADAGLGISILPASAFGLVKNPGTVSRQISDLPLASSICLVRSQDTWISTAAHAFLTCLSETCLQVSGELQKPPWNRSTEAFPVSSY